MEKIRLTQEQVDGITLELCNKAHSGFTRIRINSLERLENGSIRVDYVAVSEGEEFMERNLQRRSVGVSELVIFTDSGRLASAAGFGFGNVGKYFKEEKKSRVKMADKQMLEYTGEALVALALERLEETRGRR